MMVAMATNSSHYTPPKASLSHSGYGQCTITNYDATMVYTLSVTSGSISRSGAVVTITDPNSVAYVSAAPPRSVNPYVSSYERLAYTYHTENHQSCGNNCQPGGGAGGANSCWCGSSSDGYQTCCGGCYGQTCSGDPNAQVKNGTPSGYNDDNSEWWKIS
jgi:hypothetical protein